MRVIPPYVTKKFKSDAERKFFDRLKQVELEGDWTAYHSLNVSEHDYKRWAELDFVLVGPKGIYAFEVKGGGVSRRDGIWEFTDRYGQVHKKSEGPFEQVDSGMYALKGKIEPSLSIGERNQLVMGWGVVFPDISFSIGGPEHPQQTVCDSQYFSGPATIKDYLEKLISYWRAKPGNKGRRAFDTQTVSNIRNLIRRDFELVPTLGIQAGDITGRMVKLTKGQAAILEASEHEPRITCRGGAGTGKSFIALEMARREALGEGRQVLFVAKESVFTASMRGYDLGPSARILTYDELIQELDSDTFSPVDVLVVDEGQDLLSFEVFDTLSQSVKGGLEEGRWRWFMDPNNQASVVGEFDQDALDYLDDLATVRPLLKRNCRNTEQIIEQTQQCTGADIGIAQVKGMGPPVRYQKASSMEEEGRLLEGQLREWIEQDVRLCDIAVLSARKDASSSIDFLEPDLRGLLADLTEENAGSPPTDKMTSARISDFKGMERAFIALVDLDCLDDSPSSLASLYVGMTRAHAGLWLPVGKKFAPLLQRWQELAIPRILEGRQKHG
jgi:hypothetical protein